ncbi:MAG: HicA protein [Candidatus Accumulibacter sp.]|jgi:hypothetical protein|nr:HicA protein [Accumulibacter sp.]
MIAKHEKTRAAIFADPVDGSLKWSRIESLLVALRCAVAECGDAKVAFVRDGRALQVHCPDPDSEALRYRVLEVREFLKEIGEAP